MDSLDLNSIQKTDLLVSSAAKDKIMIKPKRTSTRHSRHKTDTTSPACLPSVSEETSSKPGISTANHGPGSSETKSPEKTVSSEEKLPSPSGKSGRVLQLNIDNSNITADTGGKSNSPSVTIWGNKRENSPVSPSLLSPLIMAPTIATTVSKVKTPTSPNVKSPSLKNMGIFTSEAQSLSASSSRANVVSSITASPSALTNDANKKNDNVATINRSSEEIIHANAADPSNEENSAEQLNQCQKELHGLKSEFNIKSRMIRFQTPVAAGSKHSSSSTTPDKLPLKLVRSVSSGTMPPKEDNKARHWGHNKTLPAATDVHISLNDQKSNSASTQALHSITSLESPAEDSGEKANLSPTYKPSWMSTIRKKHEEKDIKTESDISKCSRGSKLTSSNSICAPKSAFTAVNCVNKKQDCIETITNKQQTSAGEFFKMGDKPESKYQSAETNSSNLHNDDSKMSVIEMRKTPELTSVKAARNFFITPSKLNSRKDNDLVNPTTKNMAADKFRHFPGSTPASSAPTSSPLKPTSDSNQNAAADGATSGPVDGRPVALSDNISHSIFPSCVKNQDTNFAFQKRETSALSSTNVISVSPGAAASPLINKADTASASISDSSGASSSPSQLPANHALNLATTQTNSILPSQTSLVTSPTVALNVTSLYSDCLAKTPGSFLSSTKPATAFAQTNSKLATTTSSCASAVVPSNANAFKSLSGIVGMKVNQCCSIKTSASASITPSPVSSSASNVSTSLSSSSSTTTTNITAASSPMVKSHHSLPHSATLKSQTSSCSPSLSTYTSPHAPTLQTTTKCPEKSTTEEVKKPDATTKLPLWRSNLVKKEVKAESLQKLSSSSPPSSRASSDSLIKTSNRHNISSETHQSTESKTNAEVITQDIPPGKPSKVLDMIKNFQNSKVPS